MASAPKYEVVKVCYLEQPDARSDTGFAPKLLRPGEKAPTIIRYDGWPNAALEPRDDEAKRRVAIVAEYHSNGRKLPATVAEHDAAAKAERRKPGRQSESQSAELATA